MHEKVMLKNMDYNSIPIVMCSDTNYGIPLYVAVMSAIKTKNKNSRYHFYFMVSEGFSLSITKAINKLLKRSNCPEATWINMKNIYEDAPIKLKHITTATYYRLQIPELLEESKCLYIDVDVCICQDLSSLYSQDIEDYYLAGVTDIGVIGSEREFKELPRRLDNPSIDRYINAGVLLINIEKIKRDNLKEKFESLLYQNFKFQDQDILNSACAPEIKLLSPIYNLMTMFPLDNGGYDKNDTIRKCFGKHEWEEAIKKPVIIHYASSKKPWINNQIYFADYWWNVLVYCEEHMNKTQWAREINNFLEYISSKNKIEKKHPLKKAGSDANNRLIINKMAKLKRKIKKKIKKILLQ